MPRYFFETDDDDFRYEDAEGTDLPGPRAARIEALSALPDMAREHILERDERTFVSIVRDANGDIVFEGTLTLKGRWRGAPKT